MNDEKKNDITKKLAFLVHYVTISVILAMAVFAFCGDDMKLMVNKIMLAIVIALLFGTLRKVDEEREPKRIIRSAVISAVEAALGYWLIFVRFTAMKEVFKVVILAIMLLFALIL